MGIFIVLGIAVIFATGVVTIWDGLERVARLSIKRARARRALRNRFLLEHQAMQKQRLADRKWQELKRWHEEIDGIYKERERKLLNEKF